MITSMLAWTPFIEPMQWVHDWWWTLVVPLSIGLSMIYKALRVVDFRHYWRQVLIMTLQIVLGVIAMTIVLALFTEVIVPMLPAE